MKVWAVETVLTSMVIEGDPIKVMKSIYFGIYKEQEDARKAVEEWYSKDQPGKKVYAVGEGWNISEDGEIRAFFLVRDIIDGEEKDQEAHCVTIKKYKVE